MSTTVQQTLNSESDGKLSQIQSITQGGHYAIAVMDNGSEITVADLGSSKRIFREASTEQYPSGDPKPGAVTHYEVAGHFKPYLMGEKLYFAKDPVSNDLTSELNLNEVFRVKVGPAFAKDNIIQVPAAKTEPAAAAAPAELPQPAAMPQLMATLA